MFDTKAILKETGHRQYPLPSGSWCYFQQWYDVIFLHYEVEVNAVKELLPPGISLDLFEGKAYVSLVAFSVENMRLRYLFPLPYLSDFNEVNLRTYVIRDGRPGIYLLSVEADKWLVAGLTRGLTGIPYIKSNISVRSGFASAKNRSKQTSLSVEYFPEPGLVQKSRFDYWLTERHCLYNFSSGNWYRFDIHHLEWELQPVSIWSQEPNYRVGRTIFNTPAEKTHYAKKIGVLFWRRTALKNI